MTEDDVVAGLRARAIREGWLPPATNDAVVEAERIMQVRLPSLLRRIYLEVANGGFGPSVRTVPVNPYTSTRCRWA